MATEIDHESEDLIAEYRQRLALQRLDASARRRWLYADTESLLSEGFLFSNVELGDSVITLRTLPPNRLMALRARSDIFRARGDVLRWVVASSVWMVNGYDLFDDKNAAYTLMSDLFRDMRYEFVEVLGHVVSALRTKLERAANLTEAYCYEPYSRSYWQQSGRRVLSDEDDNPVRRIWVAHNLSEDEYLDDLRRWEHTRAQVSSVSGKGGQHLSREIERIKTREEDRRQKHIDDTVQLLRYGPNWDGKKRVKIQLGGQELEIDSFESARTFDELDDQMRRMVEGKKDAHDLIVDEYMRQIQERVAQRKADYEAALATLRSREDYVAGTSGSAVLVGYTQEQLAELGLNMGTGGVKMDGANSAIADHLYDKVVGSDIRAGWISTTGKPEAHGVDSGAVPLQDRIAARKPRLGE